MRVKAVIFDLDGTLVDSEGVMREATKRAFRRVGVIVHKKELVRYLGRGAKIYVECIARNHRVRRFTKQILRNRDRFFLRLGKHGMKPFKGAKELIAKCKQKRLKVAVATSARRDKMLFDLHKAKISPKLFNTIVTGSDIIRFKPDPQIFRVTTKRLKVNPKDCVIIEDAPSGVHAAKALGIRCIGVTHSVPKAKLERAGADLVVDSLKSRKILDFLKDC